MKTFDWLFVAGAIATATAAPAVELRGAGATFPAPLYQGWIKAYEAANPDVRIAYDAIGSGGGIKRFVAGEVDFGASDAAMTDAQIAEVAEGVSLVPATAGAVALAYNIPGLQGELRLRRSTLIGIFSGTITEWDDVQIAADNPGLELPEQTIAIVTRRDSSGTTFAFTNHLSAISQAWAAAGPGVGTLVDWPGPAMTAYGNDGVAGRIRQSVYSIGYVEYGFAERLGLPMAAIENKAGRFVKPSPDASAAALDAAVDEMPEDGRQFLPDPPGEAAYPIVTYSWLLLRQSHEDAEIAKALTDFVTWGLTEGQAMAPELGYVPLPESVVVRAQEILGRVE